MGDLLACLHSALGDACRIEKELVGCGMSRVFLATDVRGSVPNAGDWHNIVLDGRRNAH